MTDTTADALPPKMQALYDVMPQDGKDVAMLKMFVAVKGDLTDEPQRHVQQHLGSYITRLNRRLAKQKKRIEPGRMKGTYRLVSAK